MALNASGPISIGGTTVGQSINLEMSVAADATRSLNDTTSRRLAGVPSGTITLDNFHGKSNTLTLEYIVVSGGGSGGGMGDAGHAGGGGGAGGMIVSTYISARPVSYTVSVAGAGGQSSISGVGHVTVYAGGSAGQDGGSGGGGNSNDTGSTGTGAGAGTAGQGNNGSKGGSGSWVAGGGGGKGSTGSQPGGGSGYEITWRGFSEVFASGGRGGVYSPESNGSTGAANTGNGGGGSGRGGGMSGGSGIVMIRYAGDQAATGGSITTSGGYTIHTFTSTGTFSITA